MRKGWTYFCHIRKATGLKGIMGVAVQETRSEESRATGGARGGEGGSLALIRRDHAGWKDKRQTVNNKGRQHSCRVETKSSLWDIAARGRLPLCQLLCINNRMKVWRHKDFLVNKLHCFTLHKDYNLNHNRDRSRHFESGALCKREKRLTEEASQCGVRRVAGVPLGVVAGRWDPASGRADWGRRGQQFGAVVVAQLGRRESGFLACRQRDVSLNTHNVQ